MKKIEKGGACSMHGRQEAHTGVCEGKNHLEDVGVDGMVILKWPLKKWDKGAWAGLIWLRIETGGRRL